jgi:hypothetical protein
LRRQNGVWVLHAIDVYSAGAQGLTTLPGMAYFDFGEPFRARNYGQARQAALPFLRSTRSRFGVSGRPE